MELLEYQKATRVTWRALGQKVGVAHTNLNAIAHGKRECSMETARQIEDRLDGAVTANDINRVRRRYLLEVEKSHREAQADTHG
jgi:DNA-binding transcriptional regulator YdaS (Cro superfamily)